jgi:hypothetical protein
MNASCSPVTKKPTRMTRTKELREQESTTPLDELMEEARRLHASLARCRTIIERLAAGYGR